jgi:ATP-binding cassette subfamily C (CFTR/MRP) protein 1
VLFQGTVRTNLDPFGNYSDEQLWAALRQAHLGDWVSNLTLKLEYPIAGVF